MSPEQARGEAVAARADVYALGATLRQLLTPPPPHPRAPPPPPARRYADAGALSEAVVAWLEGARQLELARAALGEASALEAEAEARRARARARWSEADLALAEGREAAWPLWEESERLRREADAEDLAAEQSLQAALVHAPAHPVAHRALARRQAAIYRQAVTEGDRLAAEGAALRLAAHRAMLSASERAALEVGAVDTQRARRGVFVGRRGLRAALRRALAPDGSSRMVTLAGMAGVGKTRLALEVAAEAQAVFDAVVFCDLTAARSEAAVVDQVGQALGVPRTGADPAAQVGFALRARGPLLLVLDNLEQVVGAAAGLSTRWRDQAPELRLLATSRVRIGAAGEEVVEVAPLSPLEAVELFARRGRRAQSKRAAGGFSLRADNWRAVVEVVEQLERLPLAVELAAARLGALSLEDIARQLGESFAGDGDARGRPSRGRLSLLRGRLRDPARRSLRGALAWSWGLLEPREQAALARCAVFRGGFDLAAAEAVLDLSPWDSPGAPGALDVLEALVDDHLLLQTGGDEGARYGMFKSVRAFALEQLEAEGAVLDPAGRPVTGAGPAAAARARHAAHFGAMGSEEVIEALYRRGGIDRRRRLQRELDNLEAGASRGEGDPAGGCAVAALALLTISGPFERGVPLAEALLEGGALSPQTRLRLVLGQGSLLLCAGRYARAQDRLEQALDLSRASGDRVAQGRALIGLGTLRSRWSGARVRQGDPGRACYAVARDLFQEAGYQRGQCSALVNQAIQLAREGRMADGLALMERAQALHGGLGDPEGEGKLLVNLGNFHKELGRMGRAHAALEAALARFREMGHEAGVGGAQSALGNLSRERGALDDARSHYEAALASFRAIGDRRGVAFCLGHLALVETQQGDLERGRERALAARAAAQEIGDRSTDAMVLDNLGKLYLEQGRLDDAGACLYEALELYLALERPRNEGLTRGNLGLLEMARGDLVTARAQLVAALALRERIGDVRGQGIALHNLGRLCREEGAPDAALDHFVAALQKHRETESRRWEGATQVLIGLLHIDQGQLEAAAAALSEGEALLLEAGDRLDRVASLCARGHLHLRRGDPEAAAAALAEAEALARAHSVRDEGLVGRHVRRLRAALADQKRSSKSEPQGSS